MQLFYYPVRVVLFVVSLLALLLVGCSKHEKIDVRQTNLVQGLVYKLYDKEPFSGEVYNISGNYFSELVNLKYSSLSGGITDLFWPSLYSDEASCSAPFSNGLANGFAECIRAGEVVYKGNFNNGVRNGVDEFRGVV